MITSASPSTPIHSSNCTSYILSTLYDIENTIWISTFYDIENTIWILTFYFMDLHMLKVSSSLFNPNFIWPVFILTNARTVAMNDLRTIVGASKSTSQSTITKLAGNINHSTFISTSWSIPMCLFTVRPTISNRIVVVFGHPILTSYKWKEAWGLWLH